MRTLASMLVTQLQPEEPKADLVRGMLEESVRLKFLSSQLQVALYPPLLEGTSGPDEDRGQLPATASGGDDGVGSAAVAAGGGLGGVAVAAVEGLGSAVVSTRDAVGSGAASLKGAGCAVMEAALDISRPSHKVTSPAHEVTAPCGRAKAVR